MKKILFNFLQLAGTIIPSTRLFALNAYLKSILSQDPNVIHIYYLSLMMFGKWLALCTTSHFPVTTYFKIVYATLWGGDLFSTLQAFKHKLKVASLSLIYCHFYGKRAHFSSPVWNPCYCRHISFIRRMFYSVKMFLRTQQSRLIRYLSFLCP